MHIVGAAHSSPEDRHVHTIDLWFSSRRKVWIVERLNHAGDVIGSAHCCDSEEDAVTCLAEWLRAHDETHLVAPRDAKVVRKANRQTTRRAA